MQTEDINSNTDELKSNKNNKNENIGLEDSELILHLENNPIPESNMNKNEADQEDDADADDDEGFGDFEEAQNEPIPDIKQETKIEKKLHVQLNFKFLYQVIKGFIQCFTSQFE